MNYNWGKLKTNMFWASQPGCITQCHYDECQNLMVQCTGEKRFILFGPENFENMYPFPRHHPGDRQSQVNWYAPQSDLYPIHYNAKGFEAILTPGDVVSNSFINSMYK